MLCKNTNMGLFRRKKNQNDAPREVVFKNDPADVDVVAASGDEELLEAWKRGCAGIEPSAQTVGASRWDWPEFAWSVSIALGEFVTDPADSEALHQVIVEALMAVPGVKEVGREDKEVWTVDGDPSGPDIVKAGAVAIDRFLQDHPHIFAL